MPIIFTSNNVIFVEPRFDSATVSRLVMNQILIAIVATLCAGLDVAHLVTDADRYKLVKVKLKGHGFLSAI
ncbi:hypothetical protein AB8W31_16125 [Cronobacter sakazakii]|uniref:hypothetical protein n=1 Tax=Cronobacter sakazakii TaxID=28141 RepID=UPI00048A9C5C|nr:hypothetical protein CSK29544_03524 [Cronobacter sakazakii]